MINCDLIVTVDTVVAHLAGRLGQSQSGCCSTKYLIGAEEWKGHHLLVLIHMPFRQREHGNWQVMDRVASVLQVVSSQQT